MPHFGALSVQIQEKIKFLQIVDCHFLGFHITYLT